LITCIPIAVKRKEVGQIIALVLKDVENEAVKEVARKRVKALTDRFPLYK
jgi:glycine hydroxymethyltransferase